MTPLFLLQLVCCTVTALLALQLALSALQVRWKQRNYEVSRLLLCFAMLLVSIHYLLQMSHGLRARGADVGAAFNILFYTPVAFSITLSVINMESSRRRVRRCCLFGAVAYAIIVAVFAFGVVTTRSLHPGPLLYVMLVPFVACTAYFIYISRCAVAFRKERMTKETGEDLIPYVRFSRSSFTLLYATAAFLPVAIISNTLLIIVGPLMLLSLVFFVQTFISLGFSLSPGDPALWSEEKSSSDAMSLGGKDAASEMPADDSSCLSAEQRRHIDDAIRRWCAEGGYKECSATIYSLASNIGCRKEDLTAYFNLSSHTNFRTWLSDIRFNEAVRMMKAYPQYSNDAISVECGFSSHTQIYRIFKQKTGLSPSQWREHLSSS